MATEPLTKGRASGIALLILLSVLWGSSYGLIAIGLESYPFVTFMALRSVIACVVLYSILGVARIQVEHSPRLWWVLFWQSLLGNIIPMLLVAWAQKSVSSATATVLGSTIPLFIVLFAFVFTAHEKLSVKNGFGVGLGFAGVLLTAGGDVDHISLENFLPYAALLASSISYAIAAIYARKLAHVPPIFAAAGSMLWASIVLVVLALMVDDLSTVRLSVKSISVLLGLGALCTGIAFWILFTIRNTLGPVLASAQVYLRVPIGVFIGISYLGEDVGGWAAAGFVCIGVGLFLMVSPAAWFTRRHELTT